MGLTDPLRCLNSCTQINGEIEVSDEVIPRSNLRCWDHREGDIMVAKTGLKLERNNYGTKHCPNPAIISFSKVGEEAATCH